MGRRRGRRSDTDNTEQAGKRTGVFRKKPDPDDSQRAGSSKQVDNERRNNQPVSRRRSARQPDEGERTGRRRCAGRRNEGGGTAADNRARYSEARHSAGKADENRKEFT